MKAIILALLTCLSLAAVSQSKDSLAAPKPKKTQSQKVIRAAPLPDSLNYFLLRDHKNDRWLNRLSYGVFFVKIYE